MSPRDGGPAPRWALLGAALVLAAGCGGAAPAPQEPASVVDVQAVPPSAATAVLEPAEPDVGGRIGKVEALPEDRKSQCNRLIEVLNEEGAKLSLKGTDPASFEQMADDLDVAPGKIGAVQVTIAELVGFQDNMKRFYLEFGSAARNAARGMRANDLQQLLTATKALSDLANKNTRLVTDINNFCQGK